MSMVRASGFLTIFIPPAVVCASTAPSLPAFALLVLVVLLPLLRVFFGDTEGSAPEWSESIATILHVLPELCALAYAAAVGIVIGSLLTRQWSHISLAWLSGSLWAGFLFGSCVAHELIHRNGWRPRNMGRILSGIIGYPLLEHDHHIHHLRNGDVAAAECASESETVWTFSLRRLRTVIPSAIELDKSMAARRGHVLAGGLPLAGLTTVVTSAGFAWAAGPRGLLAYFVAAILTAWSLQAITYIQHWGLNNEQEPSASASSWEDRCTLQAWLTLGISFHQSHHQATSVPYYRQEVAAASPKAPAGYVILLFACLVPPLWRALMTPSLRRWKTEGGSQPTAGRRLICLRQSATRDHDQPR